VLHPHEIDEIILKFGKEKTGSNIELDSTKGVSRSTDGDGEKDTDAEEEYAWSEDDEATIGSSDVVSLDDEGILQRMHQSKNVQADLLHFGNMAPSDPIRSSRRTEVAPFSLKLPPVVTYTGAGSSNGG